MLMNHNHESDAVGNTYSTAKLSDASRSRWQGDWDWATSAHGGLVMTPTHLLAPPSALAPQEMKMMMVNDDLKAKIQLLVGPASVHATVTV